MTAVDPAASPGVSPAARQRLVEVARDLVAHGRAGTTPLADDVLEIPADRYTDPEHFERERRLLFRRAPLVLAASCEIPEPGDHKAMEVAGVPVVLVRGRDGAVRALLNVCTHRGAIVVHGCGNAARLTCPYHGWSFDDQGALVGIAQRQDFGEVDVAASGLRPLPVLESAGLVWAVLDPESTLDIGGFLAGFDHQLAAFGFASWRVLGQRTLRGANWKLAFDAHLDFYHLPVLHRNSFGPNVSPKAHYYHDGPHQRLARPGKRGSPSLPERADLFAQADRPADTWTDEALLLGEWIVYPHVSINSFYTGVRGVLISQIFPGATAGESTTVQTYLVADEPDDAARRAATDMFEFLGRVVDDEDLPTSFDQQRALSAGLLPTVRFGRNEGGLQRFHGWTERILATADGDLDELFRRGIDG